MKKKKPSSNEQNMILSLTLQSTKSQSLLCMGNIKTKKYFAAYNTFEKFILIHKILESKYVTNRVAIDF